jgi:phosphohistidine phosphatase
MLNAIRDSDAARLAVVGHNPGIGSLAWSLCAEPPEHPKFGLYPTGATLILTFDVDHMTDIAPGRGRVAGFVVPRELPDTA